MPPLIVLLVAIVSYILGYQVSKFSKGDSVSLKPAHSELSNPKVNLKPLLLHTTHYIVLETLQRIDRELYGSQLDYFTGKPSADKRAGELAKLGYVDRKKESFITPSGRKSYRNLYTINQAGRLLLKGNW